MSDKKLCRQCHTDEAGPDGFCSDACMNQWDNELMSEQDPEGGEA